MQIILINDGEVVLADPDDFKAFAVVADGEPDAERLAAAVAGIGRAVEATNVFVDPGSLRRLAGERADDPEWQRSLDGMLAYAAAKGWADETGAVRAHVEWQGRAAEPRGSDVTPPR